MSSVSTSCFFGGETAKSRIWLEPGVKRVLMFTVFVFSLTGRVNSLLFGLSEIFTTPSLMWLRVEFI